MEQTGIIYSIQRYCIHDGPGIRTDVFFKGCNFRCPWCANPESLRPVMELSFQAHKCTECGLCIRKCPEGALNPGLEDRINKNRCTLCKNCVKYCPRNCYTIFGKTVTVEDLIAEVEKDEPFFRNSGGGVTVTGGEPTLQFSFLKAFLEECKARGLDTAMETNGSAPKEEMDVLAGLVDHFLIDVKHMDDETHKRVTGASNRRVLDNIVYLTEVKNAQVSSRVPCIPGFNMTDDQMTALRDFALRVNRTGNLHMLHLLPYHNLGISKYDSLRMEYTMRETRPVEEEQLAGYVSMFAEASIPVKIGG